MMLQYHHSNTFLLLSQLQWISDTFQAKRVECLILKTLLIMSENKKTALIFKADNNFCGHTNTNKQTEHPAWGNFMNRMSVMEIQPCGLFGDGFKGKSQLCVWVCVTEHWHCFLTQTDFLIKSKWAADRSLYQTLTVHFRAAVLPVWRASSLTADTSLQKQTREKTWKLNLSPPPSALLLFIHLTHTPR